MGNNNQKVWALLIVFGITWTAFAQELDFVSMRKAMVKLQLEGRDIYDRTTLDAMLQVPRHHFVPKDQQLFAYSDRPLPIGYKQTISQPYMVAFMTQSLRLGKKDNVLEIGTGSGYQAAVLAEIVASVYTVEIVEPLGLRAKKLLDELGYTNITVKIGDGYHGWKAHAPFDAIMVTAGAEEIPEPLLEQLKEGGRMVIPIGPHNGIRDLVLVQKKKGRIKTRKLMPVRFVPFTRKE
ncbi:protein-L-isoaspartate(D-aspartate) O-methyltransferase [Muricauda sp. SCSIO 64092]|uniref:protein-L-isoaspartate(D-aspartate) O-methyltransferase n=1 Tax=Allomuricauda sp. SCSIO 64092 TaxID=2908842 RepID=UPI001FF3ED62|nr:protein-L-isoaspartate(D-aspartate) O-methyltransferase [Muricauda sp. SCSIO 64092]UOY06617.1 protein-L-isoaspartate(D-aspartate) O-methyltransferase [Muricauda sp. SCSIO 64092]